MKKIFLLLILTAFLFSCNYNPVEENYYATVKTEFYTLLPGKWMAVQGSSIQWFQEFRLPTQHFENTDKIGVMVYYLNQFDAWEALPSTRIFWTDKDVVYSDELWFSHNLEFLYIDYRNTVPGVAAPPKDAMRIKAIFFDETFFRSGVNKDIDWNNYKEVEDKLNLKD